MQTIKITLVAVALAMSSDVVAAQLAPADYFMPGGSPSSSPHCYGIAALYRVTPTGLVTTLQSVAGRVGCWPQAHPVVDPATNTMASGVAGAFYRFDTSTNTLLTQRWLPLVSGATRHHALGITCISYGTLTQMSYDLSTITTIGTLPGQTPVAPILHGRDLWSGDYIVSDLSGTIQLVSHDARVARRIGAYAATPARIPPIVVQSHIDGDLRVVSVGSTTNTLWTRIDPRTAQSTTLATSSAGIIAATFESSFGSGVIEAVSAVSSAYSIATLTSSGALIATRPINGALLALPSAMVRADGGGLIAQRVSSPNRWSLRLQSRTDVGRGYVIALSATGFSPGIRVGARTVPLVPDPLFALSLSNGLGALYTGGIGVLPATGIATAVLDLRRFGNALSGARIWAAAAILDPNAPNGLARVTRPEVLILD